MNGFMAYEVSGSWAIGSTFVLHFSDRAGLLAWHKAAIKQYGSALVIRDTQRKDHPGAPWYWINLGDLLTAAKSRRQY